MKAHELSQELAAKAGVKYYKKAAWAQMSIAAANVIQALAVVCIVFLLASCSMVPMKRPAVVAPVVAPVVVEKSGRIDARSVIEAASESGCELGIFMYSEGKKESKVMIQCDMGMPVPPALRKGF